jgi:hypothetical protein
MFWSRFTRLSARTRRAIVAIVGLALAGLLRSHADSQV